MNQRVVETPAAVAVRRLTRSDRGWLANALRATWGSIRVASRGRLIEDVTRLPGFVAEAPAGHPIGFTLVRFAGSSLRSPCLARDIPIRHELEFELALDVRPPES